MNQRTLKNRYNIVKIIIALLLCISAIHGIYTNDLYIPGNLYREGIHFRGLAAIMMGGALIALAILISGIPLYKAEKNAPTRPNYHMLLLIIGLGAFAFLWGVVFQHNKQPEEDFGGEAIADYLLKERTDLKIDRFSYRPGQAIFYFRTRQKSSAYLTDGERMKFSAFFKERICNSRKAPGLRVISNDFTINVLNGRDGNDWVISQTFELQDCINNRGQ